MPFRPLIKDRRGLHPTSVSAARCGAGNAGGAGGALRFLAVIVLSGALALIAWRFATPAAPTTPFVATPPGPLGITVEPADHIHAVYRLVVGARRSIDLTMYGLADPSMQALLIADHQRGVVERILLDRAYRGAATNRAAFSQLTAAGIPVRWAPETTIFHQKTLTVDRTASAIMTGNLVRRDYTASRDFVVVNRDPVAVRAIESVFACDWSGAAVGAGPMVAGLVWSPGAGPALIGLIGSARHSLVVENEELASPLIISALVGAASRHVRVEVIMTADRSWGATFGRLMAAGVQVATYPNSSTALYIHAKVIVADGTTAFVGSQNFSTTSLDRNRELGIITADPAIAGSISSALADDFAGATAYRGSPLHTVGRHRADR